MRFNRCFGLGDTEGGSVSEAFLARGSGVEHVVVVVLLEVLRYCRVVLFELDIFNLLACITLTRPWPCVAVAVVEWPSRVFFQGLNLALGWQSPNLSVTETDLNFRPAHNIHVCLCRCLCS